MIACLYIIRYYFPRVYTKNQGNSYEKSAILTWLSDNDTSPITRNKLRRKYLVPNRALKEAIEHSHEGECRMYCTIQLLSDTIEELQAWVNILNHITFHMFSETARNDT